MITPFPTQRQRHTDPLGCTLALHSAETVKGHDEGLEWVRWLFQSVRSQSEALLFQSHADSRVALIADWQRFIDLSFLPVVAPALLAAWKAASENDDRRLRILDRELCSRITAEECGRSLAAGALLLEQTRGAKYQGVLGRFRHLFEAGETSGHLAMVWAAVAVLFQLPPADLLVEYLREEWLVGAGPRWRDDFPGGALCFAGLAQRGLHQSGVLSFAASP